MSDNVFSDEDLPGYVVDELQSFAKHHQLTVDEDGFVSGNVLPTDVLSLGYRLLAWTLTTQMYKKKKKITPRFVKRLEDKIGDGGRWVDVYSDDTTIDSEGNKGIYTQ